MSGATSIFRVFQLYNGETWIFILFLAAVIWLLFRAERASRRNMLLMMIAACLFVFNEVSFRVVGSVSGTATYYRFFWMIPVVPILAYVIADIFMLRRKWYEKVLVAVAAAAVICLAGDPYLREGSLKPAAEVHYLNGEAEHICNVISADKTVDAPKVASDFSLVLSLRLQDPTICNAILRKTYLYGQFASADAPGWTRQLRLLAMVDGEKIPVKQIKRALKSSKTDYVVIKNEYQMDETMEAAGCSIIGKSASYTIYRSA